MLWFIRGIYDKFKSADQTLTILARIFVNKTSNRAVAFFHTDWCNESLSRGRQKNHPHRLL